MSDTDYIDIGQLEANASNAFIELKNSDTELDRANRALNFKYYEWTKGTIDDNIITERHKLEEQADVLKTSRANHLVRYREAVGKAEYQAKTCGQNIVDFNKKDRELASLGTRLDIQERVRAEWKELFDNRTEYKTYVKTALNTGTQSAKEYIQQSEDLQSKFLNRESSTQGSWPPDMIMKKKEHDESVTKITQLISSFSPTSQLRKTLKIEVDTWNSICGKAQFQEKRLRMLCPVGSLPPSSESGSDSRDHTTPTKTDHSDNTHENSEPDWSIGGHYSEKLVDWWNM
ncbi:uncharacterized protein IL334_003076 [Kwoniella shivajii]|uniref:F-BAR domain-containing protein n=1 Tax=Kwoniella shivajii TaxID=564305 RepID=A0ABZ1CWI9_9TREE|nr:hypothetical protein IL334_003076 [Kwoniella shivajii]